MSTAHPSQSHKRTIFVGGFGDGVNEQALAELFTPFGNIASVSIPLEWHTGLHRGLGFVEFEDREDALAAIDNMNNTEVGEHVVHVAFAHPHRMPEAINRPIWADDEWLQRYAGGNKGTEKQQQPQPAAVSAPEDQQPMDQAEG